MAFEFKLPDLGEGIHEAQVLAWRVTPGERVAAFQALCEVESAKAAVELTAPVAGRVVETRFSEGDVARLGDVLVVIDTDSNGGPARKTVPETSISGDGLEARGAETSVSRAQAAAPWVSEEADDEWFGIVGSAPKAGLRQASAPPPPPGAPANQPVRAAPFVRRLARERGVRLEDVLGSGPGGRVRIADIEASVPPLPATRATPTTYTPPAEPVTLSTSVHRPSDRRAESTVGAEAKSETIIPLRGLRKSIAEHMLEAWRHAPHVTCMDFLDVTELVRARAVLAERAEAEHIRLTYLPLFVKAAVLALQAVPEANATLDEQQAAIVLKSEYHIGVATAVDGGLVVPVIRNADRLSLIEVARELDRLVSAARARRSTPADLSGSTFTITSFGGMPGSPLFATPIVNYPEVAILGLGRIDLQPRVVDGQVVARQCIGASFTFDHRVLDGAGAGAFMATLRRYVEQPLELLLHLR